MHTGIRAPLILFACLGVLAGDLVYLPVALRSTFVGPAARYPDPALAERLWGTVDAFVAAHPPAAIYPAYTPSGGGASLEGAEANVRAACHDFPDLPEAFGPGVHHEACTEWVADYLGLYHAARARRERAAGRGGEVDLAWAAAYLDVALGSLEHLAYGPEDAPDGVGYRDTRGAVWQNPMRAVNVTITADILHRTGALAPDQRARVEEVLSAIASAWYAEFWLTGVQPSTGVSLTTRTAHDGAATSLAGRQVVSTEPTTFRWNADRGNSPSEELAWMSAGVALALRPLRGRLWTDESGAIEVAARHYGAFALAFDLPDPLHDGALVRTLNAETEGGAYGQNRLWIENHTADVPSIPYLGWTWHYLGAGLLAAEADGPAEWPELVPDAAQWAVLKASAEATLHAPDGTWLVDMTPGGGLGFAVERFGLWTTSCGEYRSGGHHVRYDGRAGGAPLYVSEIGHPAGLDVIATAWPLMRLSLERGDAEAYALWSGRMTEVLAEYTAHPPDPAWAVCGVAPYVSANPGYHWARMLSMVVMAHLGASGYDVRPWGP